jgi:hypothetical protein
MSDIASGSGVTQAGQANKTVSCDGELFPQRFVASAKQQLVERESKLCWLHELISGRNASDRAIM